MESASIIERAFAADCVDESIPGDWEDVQVELGLKPFREKPRLPLFGMRERASVQFPSHDSATGGERKARRKVKVKRKQAKKSRKTTRKKKKKKK